MSCNDEGISAQQAGPQKALFDGVERFANDWKVIMQFGLAVLPLEAVENKHMTGIRYYLPDCLQNHRYNNR